MVNPEIGNDIEQSNLPEPDLGTQVVESASNNQQTQISDGDQVSLRVCEQRAQGIEVAVSESLGGGALLRQTLVSGADIEKHVQLPSQNLVTEQSNSVVEGSFLNQLGELAEHSRLLVLDLGLGSRYKDSVLLDVAVVSVVSGMGDLPREERNHQKRVNGPATKVVESGRLRKGTMATLMADNPHSSADAALKKGVQDPSRRPHERSWQEIDLESQPY